MNFITSLFGGSGNSVLTALFALGAVIVAIVLLLWLFKLVFQASGNVGRGRNKRLGVVDSLPLDPKRQLLIIRRDNVEHLILIGGQHDIVVESGIPVADAPAQQPRRTAAPARRPAAAPAAAPAPTPEPRTTAAPPATAIEQLRELGQPTDKRAHLSLRHTGLLRPVKDADRPLSPEKSAPAVLSPADSDKEETARRDVEGTDLVQDNSETNRH